MQPNPARTAIAALAWEYPWPNAAVHVGEAMPQSFPNYLISATGIRPVLEAWREVMNLLENVEHLRLRIFIFQLSTADVVHTTNTKCLTSSTSAMARRIGPHQCIGIKNRV